MTPARYLLCSALGAALALAAVAGVNYRVDPAGLFRGVAFERSLAATLLAGKSQVVRRNFDERRFVKFYAEGRPDAPEVLVLGSSRVLEIGSEEFPGRTFFNAGVSGASVEDLLAVFRLCTSKGTPKEVVLGLDAWMLNRNNGQSRWRVLAPEYEAEADELVPGVGRRPAGSISKWGELVSFAYFQESLKQAAGWGSAYQDVEPMEKRSDGVFSYSTMKSASQSAETARKRALDYAAASPIYGLGDFFKLETVYSKLIEAFLLRMREKGIRVTVMLAPYHPEVWRVLSGNDAYRNVRAAEEFYRRSAANSGAVLAGSFDPAAAGCTETEFYDGMHPTLSCIHKILAAAKEPRP